MITVRIKQSYHELTFTFKDIFEATDMIREVYRHGSKDISYIIENEMPTEAYEDE